MHNLPILDTKQVSQMFKIPMRTIKYYTELQIVELVDQHPGIGNTRRYSIYNLVSVLLAWHLDNLGVSTPAIAKKAELLNHGIARFLNEPNPSRYMSLWVDSNAEIRVSWHTSTNFPYTTSILIDLKMLHEDVMDALKNESEYLCQMK